MLSLVLLFQTVSSIGLLAGYYLNREYIAEFLCINKQKPELKCNGKCYLKKQLSQNDEGHAKAPQRIKEQKEVILFLEKTVTAKSIPAAGLKIYMVDSSKESGSFLTEIFHPPQYLLKYSV